MNEEVPDDRDLPQALAALHKDRLSFLTWERKSSDIDAPTHQARLEALKTHASASFGPAFLLPNTPLKHVAFYCPQ